MIIAIDGPAGAGKSTTAKAVANRLGYAYIDTGAMYRAVALSVVERALAAEDEPAVVALARELPLCFEDNGTRICIAGRDVSALIRTAHIGELTSRIASLPGLREVIVAQQRRIARQSETTCGGAVLEGRDIQTVVFPDAPVKVFLTADASTRAARRLDQWQEKSDATPSDATPSDATKADAAQVDAAAAQRDIIERDQRDSTRQASPLKAADDAVIIETDNLTPDEVVERIAQLVREKQPERA
ncbi:MAG TPA: (d)CMP kinase [Abditibacteriaceae bacterium]|jgi:cytidylate kinase